MSNITANDRQRGFITAHPMNNTNCQWRVVNTVEGRVGSVAGGTVSMRSTGRLWF